MSLSLPSSIDMFVSQQKNPHLRKLSAGVLGLMLLFTLGGNELHSQTVWDSVITILEVPDARMISLDAENNIYLVSQDQTNIYKLLAAYGYDSMLVVGGKSFREEGFLEIADLDLSNRQTTYILDRGRQRISLVHPNLSVLQDLNLTNIPTGDRQEAPQDLLVVSLAANAAGDLFLLNQLDNQVHVLSSFGEWSLSFGGTGYGEGSLYSPTQLRLSNNNFLFVAEPTHNRVMVFDIFGTFRFGMEQIAPHSWSSIQVMDQTLLLAGQDEFTLLDLATEQIITLPYPIRDVESTCMSLSGIYFLTKNAVHLYPFPRRD